MSVDKNMLKAIRADIDAALVAVAKKHGVKTLHAGNCSYTNSTFTFKLEGLIEGGTSKEAQVYDTWKKIYKLPELNTEFTDRGRTFKIQGMKAGGGHKSVLIQCVKTGKDFRMKLIDFRRALGQKVVDFLRDEGTDIGL